MFFGTLRRLASIVPTFIGVSIIAFGLIRLVPGDPVLLLLGERGADPAVYEAMRGRLGLDKPLIDQYFSYVLDALQGDFGVSILSRRPVLEEFWGRFPATLEMGSFALLGATLLGIPLGMFAAVKRNSFFDYSFMGVSLIGYSMPIFWWGIILIMIFAVNLGLVPVSGRMDVTYLVPRVTGFVLIDSWFSEYGAEAFWDALKHLLLPAAALGTIPLAVISRMTRSSLLEVLGEDYIRTARAKGVRAWAVVCKHALRNALIPVITVIGLMFGTIITGAILTETIFSWPGIGKWIVKSVTSRDYPVIQGGILIIATMIVLTNLVVDFINSMVNPKLRDMK